jgi:hypothetical protein
MALTAECYNRRMNGFAPGELPGLVHTPVTRLLASGRSVAPVPSTKRRRRERRIHRRYYPTARPRLRRAGIIALVVVLAALAGILVWAAVFYK